MFDTQMSQVLRVFGGVLLVLTLSALHTQAMAASPTVADNSRCEAFATTAFATNEIAVQMTSAEPQTAASHATCVLRGYVAPNVEFKLQLPLNGWNGKTFMSGCGGACGSIEESYNDNCDAAVQQGYACVMTDTGHRSTAMDGLWARDNLQAQVDFGYRGVHVVAVAAKAIAEQFYGQAPKYSYFWGCSTGGRQGLVEAQRFPWDFNGIIAGAPWIDDTLSTMDMVWAINNLETPDAKPVFTHAELELTHRAALAKCDRNDGAKDGLISNPLTCDFDPRTLVCGAGPAPAGSCLSKEKAEALYRVYDGPHNSKGERTFFKGPNVGSELNWEHALIDTDPNAKGPTAWRTWAEQYFRYMLMPAMPANWSLKDFNFDRDYKTMGATSGALLFAGNPDLRQLKEAGGKLMIYQGWGDPMGSISGKTIDYYEAAQRVTGDAAAMRSFARLYMIPGMSHCGGGDGPNVVNLLHYMEAWVERGESPDRVVGYHLKQESVEQAKLHAPAQDNIAYSRPIFAYPQTAVYSGHGDVNDQRSFIAK